MLALRFPKRMSHLEENDTWIAEAIHDFESTMLLISLLQRKKKKKMLIADYSPSFWMSSSAKENSSWLKQRKNP